MMMNVDDHLHEASYRYQTLLAERDIDRLVNRAQSPRTPIIRRIARMAGNALVQLGIQLLRAGQDELVHTIERINPPIRQSHLN